MYYDKYTLSVVAVLNVRKKLRDPKHKKLKLKGSSHIMRLTILTE